MILLGTVTMPSFCLSFSRYHTEKLHGENYFTKLIIWDSGTKELFFLMKLLARWKQKLQNHMSSQEEAFAVNSLAPGRTGCHFKGAIFNLVSLIRFFISSNDYAPRWMPWDIRDHKSTLVQVMAWSCQPPSHYMRQCWPSSTSPYGVSRQQWVKLFAISNPGTNFLGR